MKISTPFRIVGKSIAYGIAHPVLFPACFSFPNAFEAADTVNLFEDIVLKDQYHAREHIKKGSVILDVGANKAVFSVFAESLGGEVYAFEPSDTIVIVKRKAIKRNIHVIPVALGEEMKDAILRVSSRSGSSAIEDSGHFEGDEVENRDVEMKTIDSFNFPKVDFIKIDCEGYEGKVLKGAADTIKRCRPVIAMSAYHHPEDKENLPNILNAIAPYKCELSDRAEEDFICVPQ